MYVVTISSGTDPITKETSLGTNSFEPSMDLGQTYQELTHPENDNPPSPTPTNTPQKRPVDRTRHREHLEKGKRKKRMIHNDSPPTAPMPKDIRHNHRKSSPHKKNNMKERTKRSRSPAHKNPNRETQLEPHHLYIFIMTGYPGTISRGTMN